MYNNDKKIRDTSNMFQISEYEGEVESTLQSDTVDTSDIFNKIHKNNNKKKYRLSRSEKDSTTSDLDSSSSGFDLSSDSNSNSDSSTSDSDSDSSTSESDSDMFLLDNGFYNNRSNRSNKFYGVGHILPNNFDPFLSGLDNGFNQNMRGNINRYQNICDVYGRALNNPLLDIAEYDVGCPFCIRCKDSTGVVLCAEDDIYFDSVIRTHNGLQDLLKKMADEAIRLLKIEKSNMPVIHISRKDFDMSDYDIFKAKICETKKSMFKTMDLVNSVYNTLLKYLEKYPSTITATDISNIAHIKYNWDLFLNNSLPLVATKEDIEYYKKHGKHRQIVNINPSMKGGDPSLKSTIIEEASKKVRNIIDSINSRSKNIESMGKIDVTPLIKFGEVGSKRENLIPESQAEVEKSIFSGKEIDRGQTIKTELKLAGPKTDLDPSKIIKRVRDVQSAAIGTEIGSESGYEIPETKFDMSYGKIDKDNFNSNLKRYADSITADVDKTKISDKERIIRDMREFIEDKYEFLTDSNVKIVTDPYYSNMNENQQKNDEIFELEKNISRNNYKNSLLQIYGKDIKANYDEILEIGKNFVPKIDSNTKVIELLEGMLRNILKDINPIEANKLYDEINNKARKIFKAIDTDFSKININNRKQLYDIKEDPRTNSGDKKNVDYIIKYIEKKYLLEKNIEISITGLINFIKDGIEQANNAIKNEIVKGDKDRILQDIEKNFINSKDYARYYDTNLEKIYNENKNYIENIKRIGRELKPINSVIDLNEDNIADITNKISVLEQTVLGEENKGVTLSDFIEEQATSSDYLTRQYGGADTDIDTDIDINTEKENRTEDLQSMLKNLENVPQMYDMVNSIYPTIAKIDQYKKISADESTTQGTLDSIRSDIATHIDLQIALLKNIVDGDQENGFAILKYIRPNVLISTRRYISLDKEDRFKVSKMKTLNLIDRLEYILENRSIKSEQNPVIEISLEGKYEESFMPLLILYFFAIKRHN